MTIHDFAGRWVSWRSGVSLDTTRWRVPDMGDGGERRIIRGWGVRKKFREPEYHSSGMSKGSQEGSHSWPARLMELTKWFWYMNRVEVAPGVRSSFWDRCSQFSTYSCTVLKKKMFLPILGWGFNQPEYFHLTSTTFYNVGIKLVKLTSIISSLTTLLHVCYDLIKWSFFLFSTLPGISPLLCSYSGCAFA